MGECTNQLEQTKLTEVEKMSLKAVAWEHSESEARIELVKNNRSDCLYAVRLGGNCLSVNGEWSFEPSPSNRSEEYLRLYRFDSLGAAEKALEKANMREFD